MPTCGSIGPAGSMMSGLLLGGIEPHRAILHVKAAIERNPSSCAKPDLSSTGASAALALTTASTILLNQLGCGRPRCRTGPCRVWRWRVRAIIVDRHEEQRAGVRVRAGDRDVFGGNAGRFAAFFRAGAATAARDADQVAKHKRGRFLALLKHDRPRVQRILLPVLSRSMK